MPMATSGSNIYQDITYHIISSLLFLRLDAQSFSIRNWYSRSCRYTSPVSSRFHYDVFRPDHEKLRAEMEL